MAVTKISDVVVPSVFDPYVTNAILEKSTILNSGMAVTDPSMGEFLRGGGKTIDLPFWNQLTVSDAANISSDDDTSDSTPKKFSAGQNTAIRHGLNQSWSGMDLAATLAGSDPLMALGDQVVGYWDIRSQARMIRSWIGVIADNVANDSGDMVNDIYNATPTDANRFSAEAAIDAWATLGDRWENITTISVHSVVFFHMQKLNLIDFVPDSDQKTMIATYQGKRVIVNDENYVDGSTPAKYYTLFFGAGSVAFANEPGKVPSEVERDPASGDGGGQETLFSRQQFIIHPQGFRFTSSSLAGQSPTLAELIAAANWDRVVERKRVKVACLIHNG